MSATGTSGGSLKARCAESKFAVDKFELAISSDFNTKQQVSTTNAQLAPIQVLEKKHSSALNDDRLGRRGSGVQIAPPRPTESLRYSRFREGAESAVDVFEDVMATCGPPPVQDCPCSRSCPRRPVHLIRRQIGLRQRLRAERPTIWQGI